MVRQRHRFSASDRCSDRKRAAAADVNGGDGAGAITGKKMGDGNAADASREVRHFGW